MKAKEYYTKYKDLIMSSDGKVSEKAAADLIMEFFGEVNTLSKQRNIQTDKAMVGALKELDIKWESLCNLFYKEYGFNVLRRNAFMDFWVEKIPEIWKFI